MHFNLAENRRDPEQPFAFMATYTTRLSAQAKAQHVPLGQALREYAGAANRDALLSLLVPVQRAAERCGWLKDMVDAGEIFHPLRWSPAEASRLLSSVPDLESAGVVVRMPASWRASRPARPLVTATVGARPPSGIGLDGLLDFHMAVTLDGEPLSDEEIARLLAGTDTLVLLRGQWVEIDRRRLERAMRQFKNAQALAERDGLTFIEAMRLLAGAAVTGTDQDAGVADWSQVTAGPWLAETLKALRAPDGADADPGPALKGTLAPLSEGGRALAASAVRARPGRLPRRRHGPRQDDPGSVAAAGPAADRPGDAAKPAGGAGVAAGQLGGGDRAVRAEPDGEDRAPVGDDAGSGQAGRRRISSAGLDLAITSYGSLLRMPVLAEMRWHFVILDEAQAIKNPDAKQTKAAKALKARARIALTGTPVENRLGDLWSIFDFINPGLLGTAKAVHAATPRALAERTHNPYGPLRELVRPYILRRMKTDKTVIADLPDKTEVKAYCPLSRKQAALYEQTVTELAEALQDADGIQRKGIVLATLMRLKQICNHPSQWLQRQRLGRGGQRQVGAPARDRRGRGGAAGEDAGLHPVPRDDGAAGDVPGRGLRPAGPGPARRDGGARTARSWCETFQEDEAVPFFVLSLKAGGSGLNLTAASHVVHFDRWWNPAVENQATDRAFRIGQKRNVLVHKFVCRGTVEEKIDALIESKKGLSDDVLAGSGEINLTEMKDDELLRLVALDLNAAMKD